MNKDNIRMGARKLVNDYRKDNDNDDGALETKTERIKRLEQELADLKKDCKD